MDLQTSPSYDQLVTRAEASHARGRSALDITADDVARARLYCYALRNHTIGAFHATRVALADAATSDPLAEGQRERAIETLADLANMGMETVPHDFRAVIAMFHRYDRGVRRAIDALRRAGAGGTGERFAATMSAITRGTGIHLTRDTEAPEQASFIVPNLGIMIVPLVYGDHHSWNLAWLSPSHLDVPWHRHDQGVEIHLGYDPLDGHMILDEFKARVDESYALPIPPRTRHGWANASGKVHHVPFIFGSLRQAGWGVFLDVEAQPKPLAEFRAVERTGWQMNNAVYLQREIRRLAAVRSCMRTTLVPAAVTDRGGSGGLELSLTRINASGFAWPRDTFRAVSVVNGRGRVRVGPDAVAVEHHDHFGIPADMAADARQEGDEALVLMDSTIKTR